MEEYVVPLIVALWALSAVIAGAVWLYSLLTRPAQRNPDLLDQKGEKLHFWLSEQERSEALHRLSPRDLEAFEAFHETEEAA